jgi:hypothetical protein
LSGKGKKESSNAHKNHREACDALSPSKGLLYGISAVGVNWNVGMKSESNRSVHFGDFEAFCGRLSSAADANREGSPMTVSKRLDRQRGIDCHGCLHYYVTWDRQFPHGCRAMEFKGRQVPAATVRGTSGMVCLLYQENPRRKA